jgi:hypothetical protein
MLIASPQQTFVDFPGVLCRVAREHRKHEPAKPKVWLPQTSSARLFAPLLMQLSPPILAQAPVLGPQKMFHPENYLLLAFLAGSALQNWFAAF